MRSARNSNKYQKLLIGLAIAFVVALIFLLKRKTKWNDQIILSSKYAALLPYLKAQARFETADFTSTLAVKHNNLFGMGCVKVRPTTQNGCTAATFDGGQQKGTYANWSESIKDQLLWLDYNRAPTSFASVDAFVTWLKSRNYFTAPTTLYLAGIKRYLK